ncbi:MAG TPA: hypothetical protein VFK57_17645 [Vicinamibacterales bacterium]|nr:hypothetical protein [Vicinamibacterales bacterium]
MRHLLSAPTPARDAAADEQRLRARIQAEFREMPGMMLTLPQAARLFSIDIVYCERVLGTLVDDGHLATDGRTYASAQGGRRSA